MSSTESSSSSSSTKKANVDNSDTVITKIANLYAERLMSDVTVSVGNVEYPCHRLILCASSDVFQIMLMNPNWSESQEKRIVLRETPSAEAVFEDFLKYLYTGKIQLDYATVIPIVGLADKYNVRDLLKIGLDYMARNVSTACKRNQVVSWYLFSSSAGYRKVSTLCWNFIKANFGLIKDNVDFPNMDLDSLSQFLARSDLVIEDEFRLFECVDDWLKAQREIMVKSGEEHIDLHLDRYVQRLIPLLRFPMMSLSQLPSLLLCQISKSHENLIVRKVREATLFHTQNVVDGRSDPRAYTPRLYTTERFCATFTVDHVKNLPAYHCRSLVFSTQRYILDNSHNNTHNNNPDLNNADWIVDVYPKGVWIERCLTVYQPPGLEVPGRVLKTVRVTLASNENRERRVRVGLLLHGSQDNFETVRKVVSRNYFFSGSDDRVLRFDDVIDFDDLHNPKIRSNFLGSEQESLKISIVVTPLNVHSSLSSD